MVFQHADEALVSRSPNSVSKVRRPISTDREHPASSSHRVHRSSRSLKEKGPYGGNLWPVTAWGNTRRWWPPDHSAFADAVRLVRKRGQYMQEAVPPGVGAMAALVRLPAGKLDELLHRRRRVK